MTTTILAAVQGLSQEIDDYFSSTLTTAAGGTTTLIDTATKVYTNNWVDDWTWMQMADGGATSIYEARHIASFAGSSGTFTLTTAFPTGEPDIGDTYNLHWLFTPDEKRRAIVRAAKNAFAALHKPVLDENLTTGNWLRDGGFEVFPTTATLTYWKASASQTLLQNTTAIYKRRGASSLKITGNATGDYLKQGEDENIALQELSGQRVTFTLAGQTNTASNLRIAIYDGTDTTYSEYLSDLNEWDDEDTNNQVLTVSATIAENPTSVEFRIYTNVAASVSYIDDARVSGPTRDKQYVGNLGLKNNRPSQVLIAPSNDQSAPWFVLRGWDVDSDGWLHLPGKSTIRNRKLRIIGTGYLQFLTSAGVESTAWDNTIDLDEPEIQILYAEAAIHLYQNAMSPRSRHIDTQRMEQALAFWKLEARGRRAKLGMEVPNATISFAGDY